LDIFVKQDLWQLLAAKTRVYHATFHLNFRGTCITVAQL
jgi:hypothetical protein